MRRLGAFRASTAVAIVATIGAVFAVMFPGLGVGETTTSHGLTPTDVFTSTEPEACADVDTFGEAPILPTQVSVSTTSNLVVYFTSEWSGFNTDTELLLGFRVNDDAGNEVVSTGFEWGVSLDYARLHDSGTFMWTFDGIQPGVYSVFVDARTDPVPGPPGGGNTNNNPSAGMGNCAMTVFVVPAAISPPTPSTTQSPPSTSPPPSPPSVA
jgi:hypothetical protein